MNEPVSVGERYIRASITSNLRMQDGPCDADKLLAAGYAQRGDERRLLGLRLYRMQNTGDREPVAAVIEHAHAALRARLSRRGNRPLPLAQRNALIVDTLQWWLNQSCSYCNGTGYDPIDGAPALSLHPCSACAGTRISPIKRVIPAHLVSHALWLTDEWNSMCGEVIGDMAKLLHSQMTVHESKKRAESETATNSGSSGKNIKRPCSVE